MEQSLELGVMSEGVKEKGVKGMEAVGSDGGVGRHR